MNSNLKIWINSAVQESLVPNLKRRTDTAVHESLVFCVNSVQLGPNYNRSVYPEVFFNSVRSQVDKWLTACYFRLRNFQSNFSFFEIFGKKQFRPFQDSSDSTGTLNRTKSVLERKNRTELVPSWYWNGKTVPKPYRQYRPFRPVRTSMLMWPLSQRLWPFFTFVL